MDYYLGQIGTFGFNFAPINWALCNGATLSIAQNTALFSLIGTTYGGNGQTTFELPNLQSRTPLGIGSQTSIGETAGVENVTLLITELPAHNHQVQVNNGLAPGVQIQNSVFAGAKGGGVAVSGYAPVTPNTTLNPQTIGYAGGSVPHPNIQPYLAINFCIATNGIYPARN